MTMRDQFIPKTLAIVIYRLTVGSPGLGRLPPVPMRGGSRKAFFGRLKMDGPKVGEQCSRECREVGHGAVFSRTPRNCCPKYIVRMVLAALGIPSRVSDAWSLPGPSGRVLGGFRWKWGRFRVSGRPPKHRTTHQYHGRPRLERMRRQQSAAVARHGPNRKDPGRKDPGTGHWTANNLWLS